MTIGPGTSLAHYEIIQPLGKGGMGEVFRAKDRKLGRDVAIKVLPEEFTKDVERLARFEREARVLASLDHPHVASIHGFEDIDGTRFLVMQLADGEDLSERMRRGPIPVDDVVEIAKQIAEALEAAHEQGIVHRDLKPANIKIDEEGNVKVLDFGLAKAMEVEEGGSDITNSPTMIRAATNAGVILGTAAYMSPEQARGKNVDKRTDVWAFGVVFWEMLTGDRLFLGETVSDTLASVLQRAIDFDQLPLSTPPRIRRLLRRCLERNPRNRLHDIADARIVLDEVLAGETEPSSKEASSPSRLTPLSGILAIVGLIAGLLIGTFMLNRRSDDLTASTNRAISRIELDVVSPKDTSFIPGIALSRDGRQLAFVSRGEDGRTALWVRSLDSPEAKRIPGTEDARYPFWAPDGRRIAFFAQSLLKVTDLLGGQPVSIADTGTSQDVRGGSWNEEDVILFTPHFVGPILSVSAEGGEVTAATRITDDQGIGTNRFPFFLPDGKRFLYYASPGTGIEPGTIHLGRIGSTETKQIARANSAAWFVGPDLVLYVKGDSLVAQKWDDQREELVGDPLPLGIKLPGGISVSGMRSLAVSESGVLAYRPDKRYSSRLVWVDREGNELEQISGSEQGDFHWSPRISPDGRRLAVAKYEANSTSGSVWVHDLSRGLATRLTFDEGDESSLVWSPDGGMIAASSHRTTPPSGILIIDPEKPGTGRIWLEGNLFPTNWTPDGRELLYRLGEENGRYSTWIRSYDGESEPRRVDSDFEPMVAQELSPDGRWLAYVTEVTRRFEVYVRSFDHASGQAMRISTKGGSQPCWSRDGRELFYIDEAGSLTVVEFESFDPLTPSAPRVLFNARLEEDTNPQYDITPDGKRFILNRTLDAGGEPISVVVGWQERLER